MTFRCFIQVHIREFSDTSWGLGLVTYTECYPKCVTQITKVENRFSFGFNLIRIEASPNLKGNL